MKEIERFEVVAPSGARRTIVLWQHYTEHRPINGPVQMLPGSTEYLTADGVDASKQSDGTFITFDSEEAFTRA